VSCSSVRIGASEAIVEECLRFAYGLPLGPVTGRVIAPCKAPHFVAFTTFLYLGNSEKTIACFKAVRDHKFEES